MNQEAVVYWPIPYDHQPNAYEVIGRYIAQTVLMERFIDMILLNQDWSPRRLLRSKLARKIEGVQTVIEDASPRFDLWSDLPGKLTAVARNRNAFAHRMFERGPIPVHYAQGIEYEKLSDEELHEQERQAFVASELCRQVAAWLQKAPLNPGSEPHRSEPTWPPY